MPAENEFERSMQQLLDGLRVDPAPADWDAVYEKLHPRRKRRIIWWWMPVVASLLLTALWMRQEPAGNSQAVVPNQQPGPGPANTARNPSYNEPARTVAGPQSKPPAAAAGTKANARANKQHSNQGDARSSRGIDMPTHHSELSKAPETAPVTTNMGSSVRGTDTHPQQPVPGLPVSTDSVSSMHTPEKDRAMHNSLAGTTLTPAATTSMMPTDTPAQQPALANTKKQARKWQWLLYAGGGYQSTTTPPAGTKAAMELSNSAPGGSVLITQSETGDGYHLAGGALAQRQWHPNWKLQLGLGLNHSQWQGHTSVVRDSLPSGSMVSTRSLVSERSSQYRLWMLEMPMEIGLRLAGKKQDTWWLSTGFNHQLLLSLQDKHSTQQAASNFSTTSGQQSLNSAASAYQLYWRIGLQLNHEGKKARWQLAPLFQYGLTPVYKQNSSNIHLLNLQLQWRLYLTTDEKKSDR